MQNIIAQEQIIFCSCGTNTIIVPIEHIVDLEQIMHINDVEHNCLGTNYYICFNGTKISIKNCITNYELNKFDGIKNKLMCLS